jgi:hypothetical protein
VNFVSFTFTLTDRYGHADDSYVNTKETGKLSKYQDLEIEVSGVWKMRAKIVTIMIGALGTINL